MHYDVIVLGIGGMGSAAAWQLARRGSKVLGLERFDIPHAMGSSHGISRIIRMPCYEDPAYVPLLRRAYELWREIEALSGAELLVITGSIDASPEDDLQVEEGRYYGFPVYEVPGFKFGRYHHLDETGPAETVRREPDAADEEILRTFAARYFPEGNGATMALRSCMFTNRTDEHFVLDHHPEYPQVVIASPCSGHGYKLCSVIGEVIADLATGDGTTRHDIGFLRVDRPVLLAQAA